MKISDYISKKKIELLVSFFPDVDPEKDMSEDEWLEVVEMMEDEVGLILQDESVKERFELDNVVADLAEV